MRLCVETKFREIFNSNDIKLNISLLRQNLGTFITSSKRKFKYETLNQYFQKAKTRSIFNIYY